VRIKRDPESLRLLRGTLERSPGWYPKAELDKLSDEELARAVERSMTAFMDHAPKIREALKPMGEAFARLTVYLRAFNTEMQRRPSVT
jgi:hypothetical protein